MSSNVGAYGEVYSIQHYVIKFVSDLRQLDGFLRGLRFPPPIKLTTTIYNWNIVESGVKCHKLYPNNLDISEILLKVALSTINQDHNFVWWTLNVYFSDNCVFFVISEFRPKKWFILHILLVNSDMEKYMIFLCICLIVLSEISNISTTGESNYFCGPVDFEITRVDCIYIHDVENITYNTSCR